MSLTTRLLRRLRATPADSQDYRITLEYPLHPAPRYGESKPPHLELAGLIAKRDQAYAATLQELARFETKLAAIPATPSLDKPYEPHWHNGYFSAFDAIALYGLLGVLNPQRYLEIGSGNSTKFARRAIDDLSLGTSIISIDPVPRAEIDAVCDRVLRSPLEDVDTAVFDDLRAGDILFVDSSHRVFTNSDVTVFFLEILPRLKAGVTLHIHDVFLPFDYPTSWSNRHYSEQYLLAAYLLAEYPRLEVLLPIAYVDRHQELAKRAATDWSRQVFQDAFARYREPAGGYFGTSFWLRVK
jgi:hypothetical protein